MRIDTYLYAAGLAKSRTAAQAMIADGRVFYLGKEIRKPSFELPDNADRQAFDIREGGCPYVSRGGLKLKAALDAFSLVVRGRSALDVGASTGGFTDCLLQEGAMRVYAVDSGKGQMDSVLASDPRIVLRESCNARYLRKEDFGEPITLAVMDVSFISQTLMFPALSNVLTDGADIVTLIKPQFEVGKSGVGRGGIVRDESLRREAVERVVREAQRFGFVNCGIIPSPITGGDGNHEFLSYFRKETSL